VYKLINKLYKRLTWVIFTHLICTDTYRTYLLNYTETRVHWYPWSSFVVELATNFDLPQVWNNLKRATNISTGDGVRQTILWNSNAAKEDKLEC